MDLLYFLDKGMGIRFCPDAFDNIPVEVDYQYFCVSLFPPEN